MFVDRIRGARGALVATAVFAAGACSDPTQNTDLRPDGPPEVLAVLVMNDPAGHLVESATYCKENDAKRPNIVGLPDFTTQTICDDDMSKPASMVTNAYADGWYIRVMFDELLDPDVEELEEIEDDTGAGTGTFEGHIANTHPVKLECESVNGGMVEVEYDGYYSPSGNSITWPLGPSLVIKPNHPELVATNKMCQVTLLDVIEDKSGEKVPDAQVGPHRFQIAPIAPIQDFYGDTYISPSDGSKVDAIDLWYDNVYVQFNTENVDADSIICDDSAGMPCGFTFTPDLSGGYAYPLSDSEFGFGPNDPAMTETEYTFQLTEGATILDHCGVETTVTTAIADLSKITVTTKPFNYSRSNVGNGDTVTALSKLSLQFNNVLDLSSLTPDEYTIVPQPEMSSIDSTTYNNGDFLFLGHYRPGQEYTFTLKAGATIEDAYQKVFTQAADKTITWTIAPIAIAGTSPSSGGIYEKETSTSVTEIVISFNQSMNPASVTASEWEVTDADGAVVAFDAVVSTTDPDTGEDTCLADGTSTTCKLVFTSSAPLAPGDYTFTLKAGSTIEDHLASPTVYTQTADRVVEFTVANPTPSTPVQCL
jgi:hypothetical protein